MSRARTTRCPEALALCWALAAGCPGCHGAASDIPPIDSARTGKHPMSNNDVTIEVSAPTGPVLRRGPIPAVVVVHNRSTQPIEVLLPYPNPNNLRFESASATPRPVAFMANERTVAIPIPPGQQHTCTYYLNRYLRFDADGLVRVKYRLQVSTTVNPRTP